MPISDSDLELRYSNPDASAGNQLAQADLAASLGGFLSSTPRLAGVTNDLFAALSGDDNVGLATHYRCLFVINKHATLTWTAPVLWFTATTAGGAVEAAGVDPTPASALTADEPQAVIVADETDAPAGVIFSAPTTKETGLALGDIPPGHCKAFWFRRRGNNTAAVDDDGFSYRLEGDTEA